MNSRTVQQLSTYINNIAFHIPDNSERGYLIGLSAVAGLIGSSTRPKKKSSKEVHEMSAVYEMFRLTENGLQSPSDFPNITRAHKQYIADQINKPGEPEFNNGIYGEIKQKPDLLERLQSRDALAKSGEELERMIETFGVLSAPRAAMAKEYSALKSIIGRGV